MEGNQMTISQPIEFVDAFCLERGLILSDSGTTATLTTADGESLPITLIVSEDDNVTNELLECDILPAQNEEEKDFVGLQYSKAISNESKSMMISNTEKSVSLQDEQAAADSVGLLHETIPAISSDLQEVQPVASVTGISEDDALSDSDGMDRLEDFMDIVTTYKCKFCRFSCPWKSGLMSHIRCCHITDKKSLKVPKKRVESRKRGASNTIAAKLSSANRSAQTLTTSRKKVSSDVSPINKTSVVENNSCSVDNDVKTSLEPISNPNTEEGETEDKVKLPALEKQIFVCGACNLGFTNLDICKDHMIKIHKAPKDNPIRSDTSKPFRKRGRPKKSVVPAEDTIAQDDSDSDGYKQADDRVTHFADDESDAKKRKTKPSTSDRPFKCVITGCGQRFTNEANFEYHSNCHVDNDGNFLCVECKLPFSQWRLCVMHLWKEHDIDIDLYGCDYCTYKTNSFFKLDNHKKIHSEERAFVCETCKKGFKQMSQLRNHVVIHLDRKNLPEKRWYSEQVCDICSRKFSDSKCLRKHQLAVHNKLKPYICNMCGHLSARKAMMELHMRQHTGEKPFQCDRCDYRTADHNSLRRHKMRHTGLKPYKCPHCLYSCIQAISYKTHLRNKHPGMGGVFACNLCNYKSVSRDNFINHSSEHKRKAEEIEEELQSLERINPPEILLEEPKVEAEPQMTLTDEALQQLECILPGNMSAAQLIYTCLNALGQDGTGLTGLPSGITVNIPSPSSSADGSQTITIQLSNEENESEPYYFTIQHQDGATLPSISDEGTEISLQGMENSEAQILELNQEDSESMIDKEMVNAIKIEAIDEDEKE